MSDVDLSEALVVGRDIMGVGQYLMWREYGFEVIDIFRGEAFVWFSFESGAGEAKFMKEGIFEFEHSVY